MPEFPLVSLPVPRFTWLAQSQSQSCSLSLATNNSLRQQTCLGLLEISGMVLRREFPVLKYDNPKLQCVQSLMCADNSIVLGNMYNKSY